MSLSFLNLLLILGLHITILASMVRAVVFALLLSSLCVFGVSATTVRIGAKEAECVTQVVPPGSTCAFTYIVTHGGDKDIDVVVSTHYLKANVPNPENSFDYEPVDEELQVLERSNSGAHKHNVPSNPLDTDHRLTVCLSNKFSKWTPKWVSFQFNIIADDVPSEDLHSMNRDDIEREEKLHDQAKKIFEVLNEMDKVRDLEANRRSTVESTFSWVGWGSVINCLLIVLMGVYQYWYLTKYLSLRKGGTLF